MMKTLITVVNFWPLTSQGRWTVLEIKEGNTWGSRLMKSSKT